MRVKNIFVFIIINIFTFFNFSYALQISEMMPNPLGDDGKREWIEIYNNDEIEYDISELQIFDPGSTKPLTALSTDTKTLPGEYVIFVQDTLNISQKFNDDNKTNYSGKFFQTDFSLTNTKDEIILKKVSGEILDNFKYDETGVNGAKVKSRDGKSISKINGAIFESELTPGAVNRILENNESATNSTSTDTNSNSSINTNSAAQINYSYKSYWPESEKIYLNAGNNFVVLVGANINLDPKVLDSNKKVVEKDVLYRWSFGDGFTSNQKNPRHNFKFPGEYVVNLDVNYMGLVESDKFYIKVVAPNLGLNIINRKNNENYFESLVQITNNSKEEIDIGKFILKENSLGQVKKFILPDKLSILSNRSLLLPKELTNFSTITKDIFLTFANEDLLASTTNIDFQKYSDLQSKILESNFINSNNIRSSTTISSVQVYTKDDFEKKVFLMNATKTNYARVNKKISKTNKINEVLPVNSETENIESSENLEKDLLERGNKFIVKDEKTLISKVLNYFGI